ncbi:hypothetical protein SAMN04488034_105155 [Salinimicrobium catena]|uniref:Uncharacterized protein n=1 Tax=Salinimicrobium catena TaxID=390640 RepID=A0A1H5NSH1_9FLAO|nr:hypothetical protein [Salinimicrobium catena]SDL52121.1 hypothetical protein SAMN04488140_1056 [Salinimicrobium catena]SEF04629.1 hypothetical protein SAMN04488034_105155 [Salinimicrobium catena]
MSHRNLVILTKIVLFYSLFYVLLKAIVLIFGNAWLVPNLLLMLPYLVLAVIGWLLVKKENYTWFYVAAGAAVIILTRIFETQFSVWVQQMVTE